MKVIVISEQDHGVLAVATTYKAAIDYLIKSGWIYSTVERYDYKSQSYEILCDTLGEDWKDKLFKMTRREFNDFFSDEFQLNEEEVYGAN